ncbi:TPA: hypothetical protein ACQKY2_000936 [Enterococcus faecium]
MIITVKELLDIVGNGTAFWVRTADEGECINYSREEVFTRFSHRDVFEIRCEDTDELIIVLEEEAE